MAGPVMPPAQNPNTATTGVTPAEFTSPSGLRHRVTYECNGWLHTRCGNGVIELAGLAKGPYAYQRDCRGCYPASGMPTAQDESGIPVELREPYARVTVQVELPDGTGQLFTYQRVTGFKPAHQKTYEELPEIGHGPFRERQPARLLSVEFGFTGTALRDERTGHVYRVEMLRPTGWAHCSPALLESGVDCGSTPRKPCACAVGGSHDHYIGPTE